MRLVGKTLSEVTSEDIYGLITNEIMESRILDYKKELTNDNKELLADITSFANTDGGVIVYGIAEKQDERNNTGLPGEIIGLQDFNLDATRQRIENMLRDNVDPRIARVDVEPIEINGKTVLLLGIPRSLFGPHMSKRDSKFYARNDAGKFSMDAHQIRQAMLQSVDWENEADNFRRTQVMGYLSGKIKYLADKEHAVFLHIVPLGRKGHIVDVKKHAHKLSEAFKPYYYRSWNDTYNLDGYLVWPGNVGDSYSQFFRNGSLEVATSILFRNSRDPHQPILNPDFDGFVLFELT